MDEGEVEAIAAALAGNDRAFAAVEREFGVGATDYEVMALCQRELAEAAGEPVAYEANIGLGELGGTPEAQPGGAIAAEGSLLFVDLYPRRHHYVGDSTRSFAVGAPPRWALEAHGRLEAALEAGERLLRPGVAAAEIDATCTDSASGRRSRPTSCRGATTSSTRETWSRSSPAATSRAGAGCGSRTSSSSRTPGRDG
jgi:Xaa-Pro aminopeptidase